MDMYVSEAQKKENNMQVGDMNAGGQLEEKELVEKQEIEMAKVKKSLFMEVKGGSIVDGEGCEQC